MAMVGNMMPGNPGLQQQQQQRMQMQQQQQQMTHMNNPGMQQRMMRPSNINVQGGLRQVGSVLHFMQCNFCTEP